MSSYPDPVEIGMSLAAFPVDRLNAAHEQGQLYNVGGTPEDPHATVEVYPERGVVRYASPDVAITFRSASAPALSQHAVVFHSETDAHLGSLTIFDSGEASRHSAEPSGHQGAAQRL